MEDIDAFKATRDRLIQKRDAATARYDAGIAAIDEIIRAETEVASDTPSVTSVRLPKSSTGPLDPRLKSARLGDAAEIGLQDAGQALHVQALFDRLVGLGYTKYKTFTMFRGSAISTLKRDPRFVFKGNNTFGLAVWESANG